MNETQAIEGGRIHILPGERGVIQAELTPGMWTRFEVLMWRGGDVLSTIENGHVRYFARDQRLGENVWVLGGRPVPLRQMEVE